MEIDFHKGVGELKCLCSSEASLVPKVRRGIWDVDELGGD